MYPILGIIGFIGLLFFWYKAFLDSSGNFEKQCHRCFAGVDYLIASSYVVGDVCEECVHDERRDESYRDFAGGLVGDLGRQIDGRRPVTASRVWWTLIAIIVLLVIAYIISLFLAVINWMRGK